MVSHHAMAFVWGRRLPCLPPECPPSGQSGADKGKGIFPNSLACPVIMDVPCSISTLRLGEGFGKGCVKLQGSIDVGTRNSSQRLLSHEASAPSPWADRID